MKIGIMGTGMVGRAFAERLTGLGHDVVIGTRDVSATLARTEPDDKGIPAYANWAAEHPDMRLVTLPEMGAHGDLIINATSGNATLAAIAAVGAEKLTEKVILDLALPLNYVPGGLPALSYGIDDSLGEQVQRAVPQARVVKSLNTMSMTVMLDPSRLPGSHNAFLSGDDEAAKAVVSELLGSFGWPADAIIDLGGIESARGTEMYANLLFLMSRKFGTYDLNIAIVRG
ncbi:NADPH-dependent F420 reductase [Ralstonia pseudosolanacearum]|uniref:NADPH-dependent F420 reductase n=1 Tax=Ralstonia pseudosolanacearum TaxID=1310165 RepID=UPI00386F0A61